ncbi:MAG TPA: hypothetical protein VGG71_00250, partial [Chitinophagaceae bacterium]
MADNRFMIKYLNQDTKRKQTISCLILFLSMSTKKIIKEGRCHPGNFFHKLGVMKNKLLCFALLLLICSKNQVCFASDDHPTLAIGAKAP